MSTVPAAAPAQSARYSWLTLASVGIVACVAADMVHEALGHGTASWLTGDRILSISTVALQNATANRFVSAAGTSANCLAGAAALLLLRRANRLTPASYFLWLFGAFNLLNSGYLVSSAILNGGDWAYVIAGLAPSWLWRVILGLTGATLYVLALRWTGSSLELLLERGQVAPDVQRLVLPAYLACGSVMTIASVFNPISPSLILLSGAGASFGLNAGLLFLRRSPAGKVSGQSLTDDGMPVSFFWLALALVSGGIFIAALGPGIRLSH